MHTLMVEHNNGRPISWYILWIVKGIACTKYMGTAQQTEVQQGNTFSVRVIAEPIEADPLNGMEQQQCGPKQDEVKGRQGKCQYFLHTTKIKNRPFTKRFRSRIFMEY